MLTDKRGIWAQVARNGAVGSFLQVSTSDELVPFSSDELVEVGGAEVFGFAFSDKNAFFGKKKAMAMYLLRSKERLEESPHVLIEAADFYLSFYQGQSEKEEQSSLIDDLVSQRAALVQKSMMRRGIKKAYTGGYTPNFIGSFRMDVMVAGGVNLGELPRLQKLSRDLGSVNVWTFRDIIGWVSSKTEEQRINWLERALQTRFQDCPYVAIVGDVISYDDLFLWEIIERVAARSQVELKVFNAIHEVLIWMREIKAKSKEPSDKEFVASLFGLEDFGRRSLAVGKNRRS
ncbi:hypothetical protein [Cupriavidus pinatubonensis]|nr:hypothetical protein [Cupriavidus pinatubonensis]